MTSRSHAMPRRGFTLVELIATIVILAVLGSVSAGIVFTATDGYLSASTTAVLHKDASLAMDRMTRELREIPRNGAPPAPHINQVTEHSIRWAEDSQLYIEGTALMFSDDGAAPVALANDLSAFTVRTFDAENTALPLAMAGEACREIHRIELTLALSRHGETETLRTRVFMRAAMRDGGGVPQ